MQAQLSSKIIFKQFQLVQYPNSKSTILIFHSICQSIPVKILKQSYQHHSKQSCKVMNIIQNKVANQKYLLCNLLSSIKNRHSINQNRKKKQYISNKNSTFLRQLKQKILFLLFGTIIQEIQKCMLQIIIKQTLQEFLKIKQQKIYEHFYLIYNQNIIKQNNAAYTCMFAFHKLKVDQSQSLTFQICILTLQFCKNLNLLHKNLQ
eukprot:TRINITY_DN998_c0_g1_i13.p3 TRINITY_DN998_c0_g1~~TRINITY_DN998_c0_g1_i13.p3  ORF type:complete len:205 (-),score=-14.16 TRINITY_DN998_c0_g1_i13:1480-2094(-)